MQAALDLYFSEARRGIFVFDVDHQVKPCQICGRPLDRDVADPCHKFRRWKGLHAPEYILAGHRACHFWMDAKRAREKVAQESPVSCASGGVVEWPLILKVDLEDFLKTGVDRIKLRYASV